MARILVVDDDRPIRTALRAVLESADYEVAEASDGEEGIRLYRQQKADLIILDIIMPEKEGIEATMEFKRDFPDVKIIAISGSEERYLDMAEDLGALRAFSKPFKPQEVLEVVKELLDEREE